MRFLGGKRESPERGVEGTSAVCATAAEAPMPNYPAYDIDQTSDKNVGIRELSSVFTRLASGPAVCPIIHSIQLSTAIAEKAMLRSIGLCNRFCYRTCFVNECRFRAYSKQRQTQGPSSSCCKSHCMFVLLSGQQVCLWSSSREYYAQLDDCCDGSTEQQVVELSGEPKQIVSFSENRLVWNESEHVGLSALTFLLGVTVACTR